MVGGTRENHIKLKWQKNTLKQNEVIFWKVNHKTMVNAMIKKKKKKRDLMTEKGQDISTRVSQMEYKFLTFVLGK